MNVIGSKHCSNPECRQLDFLPFTCKHCNKVTCLAHHEYTKHDCTYVLSAQNVHFKTLYIYSACIHIKLNCLIIIRFIFIYLFFFYV